MARRVLIVGPVPPEFGGRSTGGVASHVADLASAVAGRGWEVAVFGSNLSPTTDPVRAPWGELFAPVPPRSLFTRPWMLSTALNTLLARSTFTAVGQRLGPALSQSLGMAAALRHVQPHLLHFHHAELRPLAARLAGGWRLPWVITVHSLSSFRDDVPMLKKLADKHLKEAAVVIAVSTNTARLVAEAVRGIDPVVVPNGVDLGRFGPDGPAAPDVPAGPLVLYVGWMARSKGVEDLVAAFGDIRRAVPAASIALVGPTIDFEPAALLAGAGIPVDRSVAPGAVDADRVATYLRAASVLVLPSRIREGQSRVVIEAMAAGVPVVATRTGGPEEVLQGGALGTLVEPGDPGALGRAIVEELGRRDEQRLARAREAARAYDTARVAAQVVEVYAQALARRSS